MLSLATKEASKATHPHYMHGSVAIKGGRILGASSNTCQRHAEERLLRKLGDSAEGSVFVNAMIRRRSGTLGPSAPCARCLNLLRKFRVRRVIFINAAGEPAALEL